MYNHSVIFVAHNALETLRSTVSRRTDRTVSVYNDILSFMGNCGIQICHNNSGEAMLLDVVRKNTVEEVGGGG